MLHFHTLTLLIHKLPVTNPAAKPFHGLVTSRLRLEAPVLVTAPKAGNMTTKLTIFLLKFLHISFTEHAIFIVFFRVNRLCYLENWVLLRKLHKLLAHFNLLDHLYRFLFLWNILLLQFIFFCFFFFFRRLSQFYQLFIRLDINTTTSLFFDAASVTGL